MFYSFHSKQGDVATKMQSVQGVKESKKTLFRRNAKKED